MAECEILLSIKRPEGLFIDPKRVRLLKAIGQTGSINQAAKMAGVSYKSAWDHLEAMHQISPKPLLARNTGGKNGGGTALTPYAQRLLQLYDLLAQTQQKAFAILQDEQIPLDSVLTATAQFSPQSSARNQLFGNVVALIERGQGCEVQIAFANFSPTLTACITAASAERLGLVLGKEVMLMIKAPWLRLHDAPTDLPNGFPATVTACSERQGEQTVQLQAEAITWFASSHLPVKRGQTVWVSIDPQQIVLLTL